ncbi:DUF6036 family nucleotidyltransferase [Arthrobacter sp. YC-RL1]|uniref:DUF6036 family nucleotidyltransferase n=1 Tax=Arthrobacter sp. YC-RL1 TaxID=1652545 RepID=UPI00336A3C31
MSRELTLEEIRGLVRELIRRLESDGLAITNRLVGGAAIALSGHSRRVTRDVDASYSATDSVEQIIAAIADERGLPTNWLNSSAAAFIPSGPRGMKSTLVTVIMRLSLHWTRFWP